MLNCTFGGGATALGDVIAAPNGVMVNDFEISQNWFQASNWLSYIKFATTSAAHTNIKLTHNVFEGPHPASAIATLVFGNAVNVTMSSNDFADFSLTATPGQPLIDTLAVANGAPSQVVLASNQLANSNGAAIQIETTGATYPASYWSIQGGKISSGDALKPFVLNGSINNLTLTSVRLDVAQGSTWGAGRVLLQNVNDAGTNIPFAYYVGTSGVLGYQMNDTPWLGIGNATPAGNRQFALNHATQPSFSYQVGGTENWITYSDNTNKFAVQRAGVGDELALDASGNLTLGHYGAGIASLSAAGLLTSITLSNANAVLCTNSAAGGTLKECGGAGVTSTLTGNLTVTQSLAGTVNILAGGAVAASNRQLSLSHSSNPALSWQVGGTENWNVQTDNSNNFAIQRSGVGNELTLDASGNATFANTLKAAGYKSSDGSAGITGATCSSFKNGLCVAP